MNTVQYYTWKYNTRLLATLRLYTPVRKKIEQWMHAPQWPYQQHTSIAWNTPYSVPAYRPTRDILWPWPCLIWLQILFTIRNSFISSPAAATGPLIISKTYIHINLFPKWFNFPTLAVKYIVKFHKSWITSYLLSHHVPCEHCSSCHMLLASRHAICYQWLIKINMKQ